MKKWIITVLILAMTFSLAGCSNKKKETSAPPAQTEETDNKEAETKPEDAKQTEENTAETEQQAEPQHDASVAKELESAAPLYESVIRAMYQPDISKDGVSYVESDNQFFWLSVYFTAIRMNEAEGVTYDEKSQSLNIPEDMVAQLAEGCFGSKKSLPEIPQDITYIKKDGDHYLFSVSDTGDTGTSITKAYKNADGTCTAVIDYSTSEGLLGTYRVSFKENTDENPLFKYVVTNAVLVK